MNEAEIAKQITALLQLYPVPMRTNSATLEAQLKAVLCQMTKYEVLKDIDTNLFIQFLSYLRPPMSDTIPLERTTILGYALESHIRILRTFETASAYDKFFDGLLIQHRSLALFLMNVCHAQMLHEDSPYDLRSFRNIYNGAALLSGSAPISKSDFFALQVRVLQKIGIIDQSVEGADNFKDSEHTAETKKDSEHTAETLAFPPSRLPPQSIFTCVWDTVMRLSFSRPQVTPAEENQVNTEVERLSPS